MSKSLGYVVKTIKGNCKYLMKFFNFIFYYITLNSQDNNDLVYRDGQINFKVLMLIPVELSICF